MGAAQALRHQVFCRERNLFTANSTHPIDQDEFDDLSKHVLVRRADTTEVIATSRVVPAGRSGGALPMLRYCCPSLFDGHPMATTGEISRFAISKEARGMQSSGPMIRLGLLRGILSASRSIGLTHWCALMEPSLMRLMGVTGVRFEPIGPMVEAYGRRQPCIARIDRTISEGRNSHPHFYQAVAGHAFAQAA
ncbi:MAG: GNAT family N-acetyltransferase [Pseudomonadota bacterium]|nr:GNAT family N-acetyltransferase [Pseudomonadota bacterium]